MKLTKSTVEKIAAPKTGDPAKFEWDDELAGFGVRVTRNGVRSYIAQRRVKGKTRRVTLDRHGVITAEQARRKAMVELGRMAEGVDPTAEKRRTKAVSVTLREVATRYKAVRKTRDGLPLKDRTKADIDYHLERAFKDWADRPVVDINRDKVSRLHEKLSGTGPKQADQAFRVLRGLLNFAREEYRTPDDKPILPENPVGVLKKRWHGSGQRSRRIPLERLGEWWSTLQARRADPGLTPQSRTGADIVAFLTLTGLRWSEAAELKRLDVDLEADEPYMRLSDPKNRKPVMLPLSSAAVDLLSARPKVKGDYLFPGRDGEGCVSDCRPTLRTVRDALIAKAKKAGVKKDVIEVSPHDLRRTFLAVAEELRIERYKAKMLVNHVIRGSQDVTLAHYTEKKDHQGNIDRRHLRPEAGQIASYIEEQRRIAEAGNVAHLKRKSA